MNVEEISAIVVDAAYHLHRDLGPGLLESVYEAVLARKLQQRGLKVQRQALVVFEYEGIMFEEGLKVDLLIEGKFVIELKSIEALAKVHYKQVLTYLRLLKLPLGLLINFGAETYKEGVKRVVNKHTQLENSKLRLAQPQPPNSDQKPNT
jgi:GxxExxY protein